MMSQLSFIQSFVEDLLDFRQIEEGVFHLSKDPFDPNSVLDLVCRIFEPQAQSRQITLEHSVTRNPLKLPRGHQYE